jgi:hypothetical protein
MSQVRGALSTLAYSTASIETDRIGHAGGGRQGLHPVSQATHGYSLSGRLPGLLFFGVLCWQIAAVFLSASAIIASIGS